VLTGTQNESNQTKLSTGQREIEMTEISDGITPTAVAAAVAVSHPVTSSTCNGTVATVDTFVSNEFVSRSVNCGLSKW